MPLVYRRGGCLRPCPANDDPYATRCGVDSMRTHCSGDPRAREGLFAGRHLGEVGRRSPTGNRRPHGYGRRPAGSLGEHHRFAPSTPRRAAPLCTDLYSCNYCNIFLFKSFFWKILLTSTAIIPTSTIRSSRSGSVINLKLLYRPAVPLFDGSRWEASRRLRRPPPEGSEQ